MQPLRHLLLSTALLLSTGLLSASAWAQTATAKPEPQKPAIPAAPSSTTATYGSWVLRCAQLPVPLAATDATKANPPSSHACEVVQTVALQDQQQPIAQLAIGRLPSQKDLIVTALLPVNILIPGQVQIIADSKQDKDLKGVFALTWQKCMAGSCVATAKPDAATLALLRKEGQGQLRFADANGNLLAVPLSWLGLDRALDALDKAE